MLTLQKVALDYAVRIGNNTCRSSPCFECYLVLLNKVLSTLFAYSKRSYIDYRIGSIASKLNLKMIQV